MKGYGEEARRSSRQSPSPRSLGHRKRHSKKEVEQALKYAESKDWVVDQTPSGHKWGSAQCGSGCWMSVWSTPKNPGNHAKQIRRKVDKCPHVENDEVEDERSKKDGGT